MPSSLTPGSSIIVTVQYLDADMGLRRKPTGSTLPIIPQSVSRGGSFQGFSGSRLLRPVRLLAPLYGSGWDTSPTTGDFYIQASDRSVALPAAGYDYDSHWTPLSAGLAPAGIAASFAALARRAGPSPARPPSSPMQCAPFQSAEAAHTDPNLKTRPAPQRECQVYVAVSARSLPSRRRS
jgi:hypothetical protein